MAIVPFRNNWLFDPWDEMDKFFDNWPEKKSAKFTPAIDVYKKDGKVIVESPLSGIDPKEVDITIEDNVLTIKGNTKKESEVEEKNYYRKEIRKGRFERRFRLPDNIDQDEIKANLQNGMLKITLPKSEEAKTVKNIEVNQE